MFDELRKTIAGQNEELAEKLFRVSSSKSKIVSVEVTKEKTVVLWCSAGPLDTRRTRQDFLQCPKSYQTLLAMRIRMKKKIDLIKSEFTLMTHSGIITKSILSGRQKIFVRDFFI